MFWLRDSYLGVNFNDTLGRGGVEDLCWRLVQTVALIAYCGCGMLRGRPGRPVDLVMGNGGLMGFEKSGRLVALICIILWDFTRPTGATSRLGL